MKKTLLWILLLCPLFASSMSLQEIMNMSKVQESAALKAEYEYAYAHSPTWKSEMFPKPWTLQFLQHDEYGKPMPNIVTDYRTLLNGIKNRFDIFATGDGKDNLNNYINNMFHSKSNARMTHLQAKQFVDNIFSNLGYDKMHDLEAQWLYDGLHIWDRKHDDNLELYRNWVSGSMTKDEEKKANDIIQKRFNALKEEWTIRFTS